MQGWKEDPIQSPLADGDRSHTKKNEGKDVFLHEGMIVQEYDIL